MSLIKICTSHQPPNQASVTFTAKADGKYYVSDFFGIGFRGPLYIEVRQRPAGCEVCPEKFDEVTREFAEKKRVYNEKAFYAIINSTSCKNALKPRIQAYVCLLGFDDVPEGFEFIVQLIKFDKVAYEVKSNYDGGWVIGLTELTNCGDVFENGLINMRLVVNRKEQRSPINRSPSQVDAMVHPKLQSALMAIFEVNGSIDKHLYERLTESSDLELIEVTDRKSMSFPAIKSLVIDRLPALFEFLDRTSDQLVIEDFPAVLIKKVINFAYSNQLILDDGNQALMLMSLAIRLNSVQLFKISEQFLLCNVSATELERIELKKFIS